MKAHLSAPAGICSVVVQRGVRVECGCRPGGEWLECCLKLFHGARGVCLRIFDTRLLPHVMAARPDNEAMGVV